MILMAQNQSMNLSLVTTTHGNSNSNCAICSLILALGPTNHCRLPYLGMLQFSGIYYEITSLSIGIQVKPSDISLDESESESESTSHHSQ